MVDATSEVLKLLKGGNDMLAIVDALRDSDRPSVTGFHESALCAANASKEEADLQRLFERREWSAGINMLPPLRLFPDWIFATQVSVRKSQGTLKPTSTLLKVTAYKHR